MQFLAWIFAVYLAICVAGFFANRLFMYFPDPMRYSPAEAGLSGVEEVELKTPDGETLVAWFSKPGAGKPTVLYFHGNGANAASRAGKIERIADSGFGVFYLNNRSYGGSSGSPTEERNVADALLAYDHLAAQGVKPDDIVVYGESLGTGQAVPVGARREVKALVLEAPLTSTVDVGSKVYWFLPLRLMLTDRYHNEKNIGAVKAPLLILHGLRDGVIPAEMGRRVYAAANEPKLLELFPEGAHSDLFDHGAWEKVIAFLDRL